MKNILFFVDKISSSGASKIVTWLVNNINIEDASISLVTYLPVSDQRTIIDNVKRINLSIDNNNRVRRGIIVTKSLRKILVAEKIDLCVSFLPMESMYALLASFGTRTKVIVCERSDPYLERTIIVDMSRKMFRFADGAVFQTNKAKEYYPKVLQEKSVVIPNPAFKNKKVSYVPYPKRPMEISYSGRLYIKQKRQDLLLKAFKLLVDSGYDLILKIYGDGPDMDVLVRLAKELMISDRVCFEGNVTDVERRIANSRLLILTSDYEGIPNVVIEALQCGVPVVSTDCSPGGARLLIEDGINGYIVPRNDYVALSNKIMYILNHEMIATTMSKEAMSVTDRFDEATLLSEWEKFILKTLNDRILECV